MNSKLLQGKRGLILGVANEKSIAFAVAEICKENGADLVLTYQNEATEKRVRPLAEQLGIQEVYPCDVRNEEELNRLFSSLAEGPGQGLDFIVHSLAYADRVTLQNRFAETTRQQFTESLDISAFSLVAIAQKALQLPKKPTSILTMSYLGAEKVVPGYNLMGVAKAALEASVRYLAYDLGKDGIRVNAIAAGPIRTLASSAIKGFKTMLSESAQMAPLRKNVSTEDVARSSLYLLSDLSSGVSGEIHYVDAGFNIMASVSSSTQSSNPSPSN